jgi:tRNA nucleotidyltransferase/poly(A) polymerase
MIDELIYDSLKDEGVHDALQTKVSKERVGIELAGMIKADHPLCALEEVFKYKYWNIIFQIPEGSDLNNQ